MEMITVTCVNQFLKMSPRGAKHLSRFTDGLQKLNLKIDTIPWFELLDFITMSYICGSFFLS
jgi:hypothetical protein